ncbi:hypothetical protein H6P81_021104 [Aristolochia fimbriata]|uniref:Cupin type-1 domain-containing protein n=1 Tax=Aristolochia fimbriata TaxID=158543 RepID=A0AAV7DXD5_ARIFI|nr:hypothetical protein H6P81_021104 [Aristolochia fimbriata]
MVRNLCKLGFTLLGFFFLLCLSNAHSSTFSFDPLVRKERRRTLAETESGKISSVDVEDGYRGPYHLQFITLEPNSLFLPVLLQSDVVLYVQTGSGTLAWTDESNQRQLDVVRGDIYRLPSGSIFHVKSHVKPTRERLRIFAFFTRRASENGHGTPVEAYSTLTDLILGFNKEVLQMAFNVPDDVIEEIKKAGKPPQIVPIAVKNETEQHLNWRETVIEVLTGRGSSDIRVFNKKTPKTFNLLNKKPDFENCNGRSVTVNPKDFHPLKGSGIGMFMVNLTKGSMMGPHWNPRATEIAIVIEGRGMVRVVCPSDASGCNSTSIRVEEGDVFLVPTNHPMAQISFNNDSLVFVGFSTMAKKNYPQFLAGKLSVLRTLSEDIVAMSLNVPNATAKRFLDSQTESIVLECTSCAEAEEKRMEEEKQRKREEERKRREEEEARKREEEERKRREEEEARRREEEEKKKREEEEARRREEEEAERREEEEAKRREEEEEARRREEEEEDRRREEEEEARRREEEEEARRREEEEEQRKQEEKEQRKQEEKEQRRQEEEEQRRQEEEEQRRQEEEEQRRQEEEEQRRQEEEEQRRQEEKEQRRQEEEEQRRQEEEEEERGGGGGRSEPLQSLSWRI